MDLKITDEILAGMIDAWFANNKYILLSTKVGQTLKKHLIKEGYWKNKSRGDARSAYKAMKNKLNNID